jgi:hypothetical protein
MRENGDFLGVQTPYDILDEDDLNALARLVEVDYVLAGTGH